MKKIAALTLVLCAVASAVCADDFTDIIQDLAAQTACLGIYSATQADGRGASLSLALHPSRPSAWQPPSPSSSSSSSDCNWGAFSTG